MTGTIKFFDGKKGFGFIESDSKDEKKDIFVHITNVKHGFKPQADDRVMFEVKDGKKGKTAVKVDIIE